MVQLYQITIKLVECLPWILFSFKSWILILISWRMTTNSLRASTSSWFILWGILLYLKGRKDFYFPEPTCPAKSQQTKQIPGIQISFLWFSSFWWVLYSETVTLPGWGSWKEGLPWTFFPSKVSSSRSSFLLLFLLLPVLSQIQVWLL